MAISFMNTNHLIGLVLKSPEDQALITGLQNIGASVTFNLMAFTVKTADDKQYKAVLPMPATSINEKTAPHLLQLIAENCRAVMVQALANAGTAPAKVAPQATPTPSTKPKVAKPKEAAPIVQGTAAKVYAILNEEPVNEVLPLRSAKALQQKVKGTSAGSIYTTVAIGPINVAYRFGSGTNLSLRAEFNDSYQGPVDKAAILKKLSDIGMSGKGNYVSMHMSQNIAKCPLFRAVGALLFSTGIKFDAIATTEG